MSPPNLNTSGLPQVCLLNSGPVGLQERYFERGVGVGETRSHAFLFEASIKQHERNRIFFPVRNINSRQSPLCRAVDNTTQHNTTQHNTTQHNTTQHNTTHHNTASQNTAQHTWTRALQQPQLKAHASERSTCDAVICLVRDTSTASPKHVEVLFTSGATHSIFSLLIHCTGAWIPPANTHEKGDDEVSAKP